MADQKISELTALTGANVADDDAIAIVDTSATETKKIVFSELKNALDTATGFVRITGDTMTGALDVQSTITADGLTVDGGTTTEIKVFSQGRVNPTTLSEGASGAELMVGSSNPLTLGTASLDRLNIASNGDISFYEDTGTTPKFFWDASAESLGIGTSSPASALHIDAADSATGGFRMKNTAGESVEFYYASSAADADFIINRTGSGAADIGLTHTGDVYFTSGSVGIGTSSPAQELDVNGQVRGVDRYYFKRASDNYSLSALARWDGSTGSPLTGTAGIHTVVGSEEASSSVIFAPSNTERMRIDSSGNLLVGTALTPTQLNATSTEEGMAIGGDGLVVIANNGQSPLALNRLTSDGNILNFNKDGSTVGSIGTLSGNVTIGTGDTGVQFNQDTNAVMPHNISTGANVDASIDLGYSSGGTNRRFKDLYLSGSVFSGATSGGAKVVAEAIATGTTYSASWPATGGTALYMQVNSSAVGSITTTTSATAYNTSSDYRLKTDAQPMTGATDRLKQLNPVNFEWIADGTRVDGFLAHEAQAVVPEAVTGAKDAMRDEEYEVTPAVLDDDGNVVTEAVMGTRSVPDYQGIDQSKLVPLLVATIKELEARITALENA